MDNSLFIIIGCSLLVRIGKALRRLLVHRKIFSNGLNVIKEESVLNLLAHELKYIIGNLRNGDDIEEMALVTSILLKHETNCLNLKCECKKIDFTKRLEWSQAKKIVWSAVTDIFKSSQSLSLNHLKERLLINYCSFISDIEKLPNKALSLMYRHRRSVFSLSSKVSMKVINMKCKRLYQKDLSGLKGVYLNFAQLILYEMEAEKLDALNKSFFLGYLEFLVNLQSNRGDSSIDYAQFALARGAELSKQIFFLKSKILKLLEDNPESLRILKLAFKINVNIYHF